jgi:hypothetical protein
MAKNCSVTWVLFAAALMGVLVVASVVGVQGKEAPVGAGTITVGNGIYNVSVQDVASSTGIGTYTVSTGPDFPQPNENVLYGGAGGSPGTTYLTVRSYNSGTDYVTRTGTPVSTYTVRNLDPALAFLNATNTSVTVTWNTTTAPNMSDALLITQITAVEGTNLSDSCVRVTTNVTNVGSTTVSIGIRYEWDLMIDGNDGSWLAARGPLGAWLDTEKEWLAPSFESFETTDDPTTPFFSIFGTVTGPETFDPQPTPPDLLQFADWGGAFSAAFDYTPTGQIVAGDDSAVTYLWGHNETTAIELWAGETKSVTQYLYVVNLTPECEGWFDSLENEFGLTIRVYTYPSSDQSIVITDGTKTVEIQVLGHSFTCDEVVDLLEGLDLANFATLPEVMVIDYKDSVDFQLWRSRADYLAELKPTLFVDDLHRITGSGSFERPDLNLSCDGEDDCYDERIIVGVALLTNMVQGYEGDPLGFDTIVISVFPVSSTTVQYRTGEDLKLTVDFAGDLAQDLENVGAVDFVAGFGDALDWASDAPPEYSFIWCYDEWVGPNEKYELVVEYYVNESDWEQENPPSETVRFDQPSPPNMGAVLKGAGSYFGWGSAPDYAKMVSYEEPVGNKTTLFVLYYLNETDEVPALTLEFDPPSTRKTAAVTSGGGSTDAWGSPPHYDRMVSYEQWNGENYDLIVEYYLHKNDTAPTLTLVIGPLEPLVIADLVAAVGSSETWDPVPPYDHIRCFKDGECIIVELWKDGVKIAEQTFCDLEALIEQVIAFLTSGLFGVKAPALNLVGLLSLIGLLSLTASRRLKGRSG